MVAKIKFQLYLEKVTRFLLRISVIEKLLPDKVGVRLRAKCFLRVRYRRPTVNKLQNILKYGSKNCIEI